MIHRAHDVVRGTRVFIGRTSRQTCKPPAPTPVQKPGFRPILEMQTTELHSLDKEGGEYLGYYVYTCFTPQVSSRAVILPYTLSSARPYYVSSQKSVAVTLVSDQQHATKSFLLPRHVQYQCV